MPEGDTIHRTATVLRRAIGGRVVTGFELPGPIAKVSAAAAHREIVGGTVREVRSHGKHLLITFGTDGEEVVLHTHMKMTGEWHVYRPQERWHANASDARVVIRTEEFVAPCFSAPIVELLTAKELTIHPLLSALGPDIIADDFDLDEAVRRLRALPDRDIATALLDQRSISGIGNVFKVESLFLRRISPWARVADLDDDALRALVTVARDLMRRNRDGGPRRTYFGLDRRELMWVDERAGKPCRVCGTAISWGWHADEVRKSWYCPSCQGLAPAHARGPSGSSNGAAK